MPDRDPAPIASPRSLAALRTARLAVRQGDAQVASEGYFVAADSLEEEGSDLALEARRRARHYARVAPLMARSGLSLRAAEERLPQLQRLEHGRVREVTMLGEVGDVGWPEYDGGPVFRIREGYLTPRGTPHFTNQHHTLEFIEPPENQDRPRARWRVYQVDLQPRDLDWAAWDEIAQSSGQKRSDLMRRMRSRNPMTLANLVWDVANYHGWHELDSSPMVFTRSELGRRYGDHRRPS